MLWWKLVKEGNWVKSSYNKQPSLSVASVYSTEFFLISFLTPIKKIPLIYSKAQSFYSSLVLISGVTSPN